MTGTVENVWALAWLAVTIAVLASTRRMGRPRAGAWLVVVGLFLLTVEEPLLTLWLALTGPGGDPDGLVTLVTPMARAHVLDAAGFSIAAAVLLSCLALTSLRHGRRWAWPILACGLAVAALTEAATTTLVFSRGLPLPGSAGAAGSGRFGWQPLAVGLLAWTLGLLLTRPTPLRPAAPVPAHAQQVP
jgi:hypothetical protein